MKEDRKQIQDAGEVKADAPKKVQQKEKALKSICKELDKREAAYDGEAVGRVVDRLYDAYEKDGTAPTREAFAEEWRNERLGAETADTVLSMEQDPFVKKGLGKGGVAAICIACAVIIALIAGVAVAMSSDGGGEAESIPAAASSVSVEDVESEGISVHVTCEGWDAETSTPIVLAIYEGDVKDVLLSTEEDVEAPEAIDEISLNAGEDTELEDIVDAGTYTLSIMGSPILEDGTIFDVPEPQVVEYDGETGQLITFELEVLSAEEVTEADIAAAEAAAGTVGTDASKVENAAGNARVSASSAQGGTISQGQSTAQSKSSSGSSGASSGSSSSSSGSTQAHTHDWVAQTNTVHHDAVYETVYHEAEYKTVVVCNHCNAQFDSLDDMATHAKDLLLQGIYENVSYHTTKVVTQQAWSEEVLVSAAYDETVTTGYKCSGCGATK